MANNNNGAKADLLASVKPSKAIVKLAIPATLALLAKAVYNIVDTAYIGMLHDDIALTAVGVTVPLLLIMVSLENIFAAGAAVLAGRQLGANDKDGASHTVSTVVGLSVLIGVLLCGLGIVFIEPVMRAFGASDASLPLAKDYAFWMFIAALANLPAQSMNCAARAESSVKITSVAVITGAAMNVLLDPVFMFDWGLGMGVEGASLATTVSQFVTFGIMAWFYLSGRSVIKLHVKAIRPTWNLIKTITLIGIPTAIIQICLALASSLTNIMAKGLPDADNIIAAYGVVQRLILIGSYVIMGFMQGYQPVAAYAFGAKDEERFHDSVRFALKGSLSLAILVEILYIALSRPLIMLFNSNPAIIGYGAKLLIAQVALFPAFGLCYMMTITYQTIGDSRYGLFLSLIRQGLFYVPFILLLPRFLGVLGIYLSQPCADVLTVLVCILSIKSMKKTASRNMNLEGQRMIIYRSIDPADHPAVREIICESFGLDEYVQDRALLEAFKKQYLTACLSEATYTQVAEEDGAVLGVIMANAKSAYRIGRHLPQRIQAWYHSFVMAICARKDPQGIGDFHGIHKIYSEMSQKHRGEFDGVLTLFAVTKAARGKGVGSALWHGAEAYLRKNGVKRIYLYTDSACTVSFYDHKGFGRLETVPFTVHRRGVSYPLDVYLYGRNIV